jgi:hypothetical protein
MSIPHTADTVPAELAHRAGDGMAVSLLWRRTEDRLCVVVLDSKTGEALEVNVEAGDNPLDVFHHPFAYADRRALPAAA